MRLHVCGRGDMIVKIVGQPILIYTSHKEGADCYYSLNPKLHHCVQHFDINSDINPNVCCEGVGQHDMALLMMSALNVFLFCPWMIKDMDLFNKLAISKAL